jgi:hypothetical protein
MLVEQKHDQDIASTIAIKICIDWIDKAFLR